MRRISAKEVTRRTGVDGRTRCARCKRTARACAEAPATDTGIDHFRYRYTNSFYTSAAGRHTCAACHKEEGLESCFAAMDARDKERSN